MKSGFFGANFTPNAGMTVAQQKGHFDRLSRAGVKKVRIDVAWATIEQQEPDGNRHRYDFGHIDRVMAAAARAKLRPNVTISQAPRWAQTDDLLERLQCDAPGIRTRRPIDLNSYALAAGEVAKRYGRSGTFWQANPGLPRRPIGLYYIWNEQSTFPNWCPMPDPAAYAYMFVRAAAQIKAADPRAKPVTGGIPDIAPHKPPRYLPPGDFLAGMVQAEPGFLELAAGIPVNLFWYAQDEGPLDKLAWFRQELRRGGVPDSEPMIIAEFGWPRSGPSAFTEDERTQRLGQFTKAVPRSNCNVQRISLHTWISEEEDHDSNLLWFGVADPSSTEPYKSGHKYMRMNKLFRGKLNRRAPRGGIEACPGMPLPDRDHDGVLDQDDRWPLNPSRH